MSLSGYLIASFVAVFTGTATLLLLNKALRAKRGALSKTPSLEDLNWLSGVAMIQAAALWLHPYAAVLTTTVFCVFGLLIWLDALLFVQYRIEVNRETIMWFFKGTKGLLKGAPHLFEVLSKFRPAILIPLFTVLVFILSVFASGWVSLLFAAIILLVCVLAVNDNRWLTAGLIATLILLTIIAWQASTGDFLPATQAGSMCVIIIGALNLYKLVVRPGSAFFTTPSLLPNILSSDDFTLTARADEEQVQRFMTRPGLIQPSPLSGTCQGASIILITMESLGCYIHPYSNGVIESRLAKRFGDNRWFSRRHYSLCPNTTVSTNQMYTGGYSNNPYNKDDSAYYGGEPQYINRLKQAGYTTLFLDSANTGLYDYWKLLKRIGFDHIWGTADLPSNGLTADYRLWNMVDEVADKVGIKPFFLHLINDQTHMPYEVVDTQRFNRHKGNSQKALYLNAVEEADFIIDEFLTRLSEKLDLSNTILVFTGDHGESFGEYGYSFHSNSVIPEQTQVPFMLMHPALSAKDIEHSSHFDLFPTFFDLLGIACDTPGYGQSLGLDSRPLQYFFHSATLKGNTPANFSFMQNNELYWFDRLFNQVYRFCFVKNKWVNMPVEDKAWVEAMLGKHLLEKGLIKTG